MSAPVSELHAAARRYASEGTPVFPCAPGRKEPWTEHGFHDATTDLAQIDAWWTAEPRLNVAFCPHQVGLAIIDPDGEEGLANWDAWQIEHGFLPPTFTVRTPRGGVHLYYAGDLPPTQSKLAPHVDTRGVGSYALLPPSHFDGHGDYVVEDGRDPAELPPTVGAFLARLRRDPAKATTADLDRPQNVARAERLLRDYVERGHVAVEGQMGDKLTFVTACEVLNLGLSPDRAFDLIAELWNPHCLPPWDEDELRQKVENASRYAQNEAGAWATDSSQEAFGDSPAVKEAERLNEPATYPRPLSMGELAHSHFPRPAYAVEKMIVERVVNLLYGDGGAGKTLLLLLLALTIALGRDLWGLKVKQMPVLLVLAEDDYGVAKERLEAMCAAYGCTLADVPIKLWCLPGHDLRLATIADDGSWTPGPFLEPLKAALAEIGPCFLGLDTAIDFAALNENLRPPVNTLCKVVLGGLCREFGVTTLVNAHPSKAAMADGSHYAGSTAWNAAVRSRLSLTKVGEGANPKRILRVEKTNYGQEHEWELYQLGLTFATQLDREGEHPKSRFIDACVQMAIAAAESDQPIQLQRRVADWVVEEIERLVGYRPTNRDIKEALKEAQFQRRLRYVGNNRHKDAGWYPWDEERAADLARAAKQRRLEGDTHA